MGRLKYFLRSLASPKLIDLYYKISAVMAAVLYRFPAQKMRVIGVTGTNGKTTTCHLISAILSASGRKVGMVTTIDFQIGDNLIDNELKMTTISPFKLQALLKKMADASCQDVILEVTSIGLDQHRLWGIKFHAAVFTNLTHDHLDYHGTMEEYRLAKEKLFENRPALSVINADDEAAEHFIRHTANRTLTYGLNNPADLIAKKVLPKPSGSDFVILLGQKQASVSLPLPGRFNVYNALAAAATCIGLGAPLEAVIEGLERTALIPGRMEVVDEGQPFTVIIDYAHSPDALQKVYETIKPTVRGKLIAVLGSAGDRDKAKRPILGSLAGRYADYVFITNEDPYHEDPQAIIDAVAAGVPKGRPRSGGRLKINRESEVPLKYRDTGEGTWWWRIMDRREAIDRALALARPQDLVVITGKGAEKVMVVDDQHIPWSDRVVLAELLKKYKL